MKLPGKGRINIKNILLAFTAILVIAETVAAGWFIYHVLYGKPTEAGEIAGASRQTAQVDPVKVDAIFSALETKTAPPDEESLDALRNPFKEIDSPEPPALQAPSEQSPTPEPVQPSPVPASVQ